MARAELPSSFGQDLGGCVSQAELLCPHPGLSIASKKHVPKAVPKGKKNKETHVSGCATGGAPRVH